MKISEEKRVYISPTLSFMVLSGKDILYVSDGNDNDFDAGDLSL